MDRRCFITWVTGVGATLTLPKALRPTMKWKPAQEFWMSTLHDWERAPALGLFYRDHKEMFVPVTGEHPPSFGYGTPWELMWARDMEPNFGLGAGMPDASLLSKVTKHTEEEMERNGLFYRHPEFIL